MNFACQVIQLSDFRDPWYVNIAEHHGIATGRSHRKDWEHAAIFRAFWHTVPEIGARVLGFGVGREPLPEWFAQAGASVVATDIDPADARAHDWLDTRQHLGFGMHDSTGITYRSVDMSNLDAADLPLDSFDFTWSAGSLEHIGGLRAGLDFFVRQMRYLKPGRYVAHTTEFNPLSDDETIDAHNLALYRRRDFIELRQMMEDAGYELGSIDSILAPWSCDVIDEPPYDGDPHIAIRTCGHVTTSVLLVARRPFEDRPKGVVA